MATLPTTVRDNALALSTDLAQAGVVFNDATRLLEGGLWSTPADSNNQVAYLGMFTADIHAVLNDINAALANPNGVTVSEPIRYLQPIRPSSSRYRVSCRRC